MLICVKHFLDDMIHSSIYYFSRMLMYTEFIINYEIWLWEINNSVYIEVADSGTPNVSSALTPPVGQIICTGALTPPVAYRIYQVLLHLLWVK